MSLISGKWYPQNSSTQHSAHLKVEGVRYEVQIASDEITDKGISEQNLTGQWAQITIDDRLGNIERKLILADGSVFTTADNDAVDSLIRDHKDSGIGSKWNLFLHHHETKITSVLAMLILTVIFAFGFIRWGIPWTSQAIAHALPQKTAEFIGKQSLDFIDRYFLEPTQISQAEQQKISSRFKTRLKPFGGDNTQYQLHFRNMSIGGVSLPNAFALPSGDIILTDKFVELSQDDNEIDAVLLHEMGHVVERHGLEMLTQNSLTTMLVILVLGNPDGISELTAGLGAALVSNHYSRQYETEADEFAFNNMLEVGIDPQAFIDILSRMEEHSTTAADAEATDGSTPIPKPDQQEHNDEAADEDKLSDFLATHPNTQLRIKKAEKYSQCFAQGLKVCQ